MIHVEDKNRLDQIIQSAVGSKVANERDKGKGETQAEGKCSTQQADQALPPAGHQES